MPSRRFAGRARYANQLPGGVVATPALTMRLSKLGKGRQRAWHAQHETIGRYWYLLFDHHHASTTGRSRSDVLVPIKLFTGKGKEELPRAYPP